MAPIVPELLGLGFFANLGDTNHFFQPWLNDRNGRGSVFTPSFLSRLFGKRKKRSLGSNEPKTMESIGKYMFLFFRMVRLFITMIFIIRSLNLEINLQ